ncbi:MAG: COX15/CtaA family protein [Thermoanaerobaculia bacterium]
MKDTNEPNQMRMRHYTERTPLWLRRFTKLVAASTLFLIFAGAMVTSTGSGLAVPDWPLSYGMLMPPMVGGIFYEHGHRMIATAVGILTIIQAVWLQKREPKRFVRVLGWTALGAVVVQGLLGGITVLLLLPKAVSVSHAGLAEIFFAINVSIAFFTSEWFYNLRAMEKGRAPVGLTTFFAAAVYVQIIAGAVMRHLGAGLAIPDFPLSFGRLVPEFANGSIVSAFVHRAGGFTVGFLAIAVVISLLRYEAGHPLRGLANILLVVVAAQILLGGYVIWSGKQAHITSLHVMIGASTWALSVVLALAARTLAWKKVAADEPAGYAGREVTA